VIRGTVALAASIICLTLVTILFPFLRASLHVSASGTEFTVGTQGERYEVGCQRNF
jgi:hypothetical protein